MAFDHPTPEALLGRSDSKNPASTCRGLTAAGKPCRRALAAATKQNGILLQPGIVAVVESDGRTLDAAYYCWQHKAQAHNAATTAKGKTAPMQFLTVTERTSIDSLAERIGVLRLDKEHQRPAESRGKPRAHTAHDDQQRSQRDRESHDRASRNPSSRHRSHSRPSPARRGFFASLCCFSDNGNAHEDISEKTQLERYSRTTQQRKPSRASVPSKRRTDPTPGKVQRHDEALPTTESSAIPRRPLGALSTNRANISSLPNRHSTSHIPPNLDSATTAALTKELLKPISPRDEEGYIYMFWLSNPETTKLKNATGTASNDTRITMDHLLATQTNRKILVKIGRASNVHRRLSEWTQQCGYALSLLRWYPHVQSPLPSPTKEYPARTEQPVVRKVPHVHRVERLIHLELTARRVKRTCAACGKEHREWFEIEATADGIGAIDATIKRWVRWAETTASI